jgi:hypothetical protein
MVPRSSKKAFQQRNRAVVIPRRHPINRPTELDHHNEAYFNPKLTRQVLTQESSEGLPSSVMEQKNDLLPTRGKLKFRFPARAAVQERKLKTCGCQFVTVAALFNTIADTIVLLFYAV